MEYASPSCCNRRCNQLDARSIGKFDVRVAYAIRMQMPRLDHKAQAPVRLSGLLQVLDHKRNMVYADQ
jgi:hypothetical protein